MPIISTFYGIIIRMYFFDHNPPHFHVQCGNAAALVAVSDGDVIAGKLPKTAARLVKQWAMDRHLNSRRTGSERASARRLNGFPDQMVTAMSEASFPMVDVVAVRALPGYRLHLQFSTGEEGEFSLRDPMETDAPMLRPLKDESEFARVFVEHGSPVWPNGFDLDSIALYMDMKKEGLLSQSAA